MSMIPPRDPLDAALGALPQEIVPPRDLWPGIRAAIDAAPPAQRHAYAERRWPRLAASAALMLLTVAATYVLTRQAQQTEARTAQAPPPAPALVVMPASFGAEPLSVDYFKARAALDAEFERRVAALPPQTRAKLAGDLADLRRAANDIATTLAQHPSDPLLQELMMSAYQRELRVFADVTQLTARTVRTDL